MNSQIDEARHANTNSRIFSIYAYRGLMLFSMTLNHLILFPFICLGSAHEWLQKYVYGTFGYLSNSEGFFFLAGLISGVVYGKSLLFRNGADLWPRIKKRILQIYSAHLILLFAFALFLTLSSTYVENWKHLHTLIEVWKEHDGIHYFLDHPGLGFIMGSVFLYSPPFFDILSVYMLFLALTPCVLRMLLQGRTVFVFAVSVCLWLVPQYFHENLIEDVLQLYLPVKLGWFNPLAIQLLFVSGLAVGFFHVKGTLFTAQRLCLLAGLSLTAMYVILCITNVDLSSCHHLGFLRLATFMLLGKHSLPVFGYHIACVYALVFFLPEISSSFFSLKLIYLALAVSSIWILAHFLEKRRKKAYLKPLHVG